jgi:hypothetical protein
MHNGRRGRGAGPSGGRGEFIDLSPTRFTGVPVERTGRQGLRDVPRSPPACCYCNADPHDGSCAQSRRRTTRRPAHGSSRPAFALNLNGRQAGTRRSEAESPRPAGTPAHRPVTTVDDPVVGIIDRWELGRTGNWDERRWRNAIPSSPSLWFVFAMPLTHIDWARTVCWSLLGWASQQPLTKVASPFAA